MGISSYLSVTLKKPIALVNQNLIPKADTFWTFGEGHRRLACVRRWIPWFGWVWCEQVDQSQHSRDGHAPFFCDAKSNFKETLVSHVQASTVCADGDSRRPPAGRTFAHQREPVFGVLISNQRNSGMRMSAAGGRRALSFARRRAVRHCDRVPRDGWRLG
jgi:hypothetical protein